MNDRLAPSRTMSTTPVAVECENVVRTMTDNSASVSVWWHDQWKSSERAGDLQSLLHQSWLSTPLKPARRPKLLGEPLFQHAGVKRVPRSGVRSRSVSSAKQAARAADASDKAEAKKRHRERIKREKLEDREWKLVIT